MATTKTRVSTKVIWTQTEEEWAESSVQNPEDCHTKGLKGIVPQFFLSIKSHILDSNGVW